MNLNTTNWKGFVIHKLFKLENGKANQGMLEEGDECFYVGAKKDDNGVMIHCMKDNALTQKGNCIIFICNGQGSVGYANYMDVDFIGTTDIVAGYNENINAYNGLFIATVLCQERPKYSFGRKWKTHLKGTIIDLPIQCNPDGTPYIDNTYKYSDCGYVPDWQWMENYIKSLHHKMLTTKNKVGKAPKLKVNEWKEFKIPLLFDVCAGSYYSKDEYETGSTPYVSASDTKNGIGEMTNLKPDFTGNKITIGKVGATAYYQSDNFCATSDVNVLTPLFDMNKYHGLFITQVINTSENYKWSYGRQCRVGDTKEIIIKLPIQYNSDGTPIVDDTFKYSDDGYIPDWQFMECYIKSLPYGDRL